MNHVASFFRTRKNRPFCAIAILLAMLFTSSTSWGQEIAKDTKKIAFLVGVNDYFKKNLKDLNYCENDITVVAQQLKALGFETTVLTGRDATREKIIKGLDAFIEEASELETDDIVLAMFSGHGQQLPVLLKKKVFIDGKQKIVTIREESPFYCARDAIPFNQNEHTLRGKTEEQVAQEFNLIPFNELIGRLDTDSNSLRNLLIVDACRNDPSKGSKTANISGSTVNELPNGLSILFSAKSGQKSWESADPNIRHGVMSHFLIQGLKGKAVDDQGEYTWGDLTNYIKKNVIRNGGKLAGGSDRIQNPHSINSNSDVIVLGRMSRVAMLEAPFGKREISETIDAIGMSKGLKPTIKNAFDMEFKLIPAGNYTMDAIKDKKGKQVTFDSEFYLGRFEVTQGQWREVMGTEPWKSENRKTKIGDNYPATYISWDDANEFCRRLSEREGKNYRLPAEAEWEYACRCGSEQAFSFGDDESDLENFAWYRPKKHDWKTKLFLHPVGQKRANGFGLYDMYGNASEWCSDRIDNVEHRDWHGNYYRVVRGGNYNSDAGACRMRSNSWGVDTSGHQSFGFRVVRSLKPFELAAKPKMPIVKNRGIKPLSFVFNKKKNSSYSWRSELGSVCYTRPATAQGKVFIGTNNGGGYRKGINSEKDKGVLLCFDDSDGSFLWQLTRDKLESGRVNDWPLQGIVSQPCAEGDRLWVLTNRAEIMCLDTEGFHDGENDGAYTTEKLKTKQDADVVWSLDMIEELGVFPHNKAVGDPIIFEDLLFINTSNGVDEAHTAIPSPRSPTFLAINKNTGEVVWENNQPFDKILHGSWASPAVGIVNGVPQVYFPGGDGWLYAFHARTGKLIWKFDLNPKDSKWVLGGTGNRNGVLARPIVYENSVILAVGQDPEHGEGTGHLWRIDATGKGDVSAELGAIGKKGRPNPNSRVIWHFGGVDKEGEDIFRRTLSSPAITPSGLLVISDLSGFIHCLDVESGHKHWEYDTLSGIWGSPVFFRDHILIGDEDGIVNVFDASSTQRLKGKFDTVEYSSIYATIHIDGSSVYITDRHSLTKFDFGDQQD